MQDRSKLFINVHNVSVVTDHEVGTFFQLVVGDLRGDSLGCLLACDTVAGDDPIYPGLCLRRDGDRNVTFAVETRFKQKRRVNYSNGVPFILRLF